MTFSKIERRRKLRIDFQRGHHQRTGSVPKSKEPRYTPGFRFVRVYRKCLVVAAARVRDMICTSSYGTLRSKIDDVENKRRMYRNRGMQAPRRLPGPVPDTANEIAPRSRRLQGQAASIACNGQPLTEQASHADLHSLNRRIDVA